MKKLSNLIKEKISINEGRNEIKLTLSGKDIVKDIENAIEEITYVYNEEFGISFDKRELEKIKKELNNYINKFFIENEDEDD